jgi:hypothetical protein
MEVFCFVDNCNERAKGTFISNFQFNKFCPSHRREDARPAQRMRYTMDQLKARVKKYMESMTDLLNTNKKIYLVTVSRQGNVEHLKRQGVESYLFLETLLDKDEAYIVATMLLFELITAGHRGKLLNTVGLCRITSPGKVDLKVGIFDENTDPWLKNCANMMLFREEFEKIISFAQKEPEMILNRLIEMFGVNLPLFIYGKSFQLQVRNINYDKLHIFHRSTEKNALRHSGIEDFSTACHALHEAAGIFFIRLHPILGPLCLNEFGGADNIPKEFPQNALKKDVCSYYHTVKEGVPGVDVHTVRNKVNDYGKWVFEDYPCLENLSPKTVEYLSETSSDILVHYQRKLLAENEPNDGPFEACLDADGSFNLSRTFEILKVCNGIGGISLKAEKYKNIKCKSCGNIFQSVQTWIRHLKGKHFEVFQTYLFDYNKLFLVDV